MSSARRLIATPRLRLRAPDPALADAVAAYLQRNAAHLAPWDPPRPPGHAEPARLKRELAAAATAFDGGLSLRWWLTPAEGDPNSGPDCRPNGAPDAAAVSPPPVIGSVQLSNLARGAFQSCTLGYALDAGCQGRGLMREALAAVIAEAFGPGVHLHRLQAAVRPENARSLALLQRLGFRDEGLARDYLFIAGAWRDHRLFALTNPGFLPPADWLRA